ncbi:MAG: C39 family peptidase, partial [Verrucomicrobia bacterium]|nr:C39 family peptidase [Verrucomicrobiota bacterium]
TCNLQLFDPTWFAKDNVNLCRKLQKQQRYKKERKMTRESRAFMDFLKLGGRVRMEDLTRDLIRRYLRKGIPILTGLSSTFLYRSARETGEVFDDLKGKPSGHFVVLCGYDKKTKHVRIADPFGRNPYSPTLKYEVHIDRVICSILLGAYTYDANFLIIRPKDQSRAM